MFHRNRYLFLLLVFSSSLLGEVISLNDAVREVDEGRLSIAIESKSPEAKTIVRRAFTLHGGYSFTEPLKAKFTFQFEPISNSSVELVVLSGRQAQELYRRKVLGHNLQDAVLKACDVAVEATSGSKGFFAGKLAFVRKQKGVSEIYVGDLLFNTIRPLTDDRSHVLSPDWSPDGTKLIYTTYHKTGFPDIYMIDVTSGRRVPIANFNGANFSPSFSPNGRQIAMTLSGKKSSDIFIMDSIGQKPRPITRGKSLETSPSWSPDGRSLIFESDKLGKPQIYEVASSGGSMRRLPTNVSRYCSEPDWNPVDKNLIAFTAAFSSGYQIVLYDRQAQRSVQLTNVAGSAVEPEWLNDGRHLLFTQKQNGTKRLMILDSQTKKVSSLHRTGFGDTSSATFVY